MRANIIGSVGEELKALARRSSPEALKAADGTIAAAIRRRHGEKAGNVLVTVVRADEEICAATVRFEGPISGIGDREYIRFRRKDGE
jgi:hypothetical protein